MNDLVHKALVLSFYLAGVPLGVVTLTGLVVSVLQAATQIQDQTIAIVPKMLSIVIVLYLAGSWMISELEELFLDVLSQLPHLAAHAGG